MTQALQKCRLELLFLPLTGFFFCCLVEQRLISRFGKERLNNIWQVQVPPRRAYSQASHSGRETWQCPARLCPLPQAWFTQSLVPDEYHGVVFEYIDFMQKRPLRQATCKSISDRQLWPAKDIQCFLSAGLTGMHWVDTVNPAMITSGLYSMVMCLWTLWLCAGS